LKSDDVKPGSLVRVEVDGTAICLARTEGGEFRAVADRCTHEDYSLSDGSLWDDQVECPAHGSLFDLNTGDVTGLPAFEPTRVYPVTVEDGEVVLEL
jgi:3-phenylpropionate/trans-cinnamate dioxygenase ferredoxin subunit